MCGLLLLHLLCFPPVARGRRSCRGGWPASSMERPHVQVVRAVCVPVHACNTLLLVSVPQPAATCSQDPLVSQRQRRLVNSRHAGILLVEPCWYGWCYGFVEAGSVQEAGRGPVPVRGGASPEHAHQPAELHAGTLMQPTVCFTVLL